MSTSIKFVELQLQLVISHKDLMTLYQLNIKLLTLWAVPFF